MPRGLSLHIGLNRVNPERYAGWEGPLASCEADMLAMRDICHATGFQTSILPTEEATRDGLISRLHGVRAALTSGDTFLISYAGHGGQLRDIRGGDEGDGKDETWCLFDGHFLDDELHALWMSFRPGVRVSIYSDSCHSASMHKMVENHRGAVRENWEPRCMPKVALAADIAANGAHYRALFADVVRPTATGVTGVMIGAAKDDELAWGDESQGLFTRAVMDVWAGGSFNGGHYDFTRALRFKTPSTPQCQPFGASNAGFYEGRPFQI